MYGQIYYKDVIIKKIIDIKIGVVDELNVSGIVLKIFIKICEIFIMNDLV